jgi:hypothetical protein
MVMRAFVKVLAAVVASGFLAATKATSAPVFNYPWCANYMTQPGAKNCGFTTLEQCNATVSGVGGFCAANPAYIPPAAPRLRPVRQG